MPAPIAADLLGLQVATAARWAAFTRRDWTDYLAARSQDLHRTASTPIPDPTAEG